MNFKIIVSTIAMAAALGFAAPAYSQTPVMINGVEVPAAELDLIVQHCESLAAADMQTDSSQTEETTPDMNNDNSTDSDSSSNSSESELGAAGDVLSIDLDTVSLATCKESGILDAGVIGGSDAMAAEPMAAEPMTADTMASMSEGDKAIILQHCEALAAAEMQTDSSQTEETTAENMNNDNSTDSDSSGNAATSELGAGAMGIDLDAISLASCKEMGVI